MPRGSTGEPDGGTTRNGALPSAVTTMSVRSRGGAAAVSSASLNASAGPETSGSPGQRPRHLASVPQVSVTYPTRRARRTRTRSSQAVRQAEGSPQDDASEGLGGHARDGGSRHVAASDASSCQAAASGGRRASTRASNVVQVPRPDGSTTTVSPTCTPSVGSKRRTTSENTEPSWTWSASHGAPPSSPVSARREARPGRSPSCVTVQRSVGVKPGVTVTADERTVGSASCETVVPFPGSWTTSHWSTAGEPDTAGARAAASVAFTFAWTTCWLGSSHRPRSTNETAPSTPAIAAAAVVARVPTLVTTRRNVPARSEE